jgi:hypothetical protein
VDPTGHAPEENGRNPNAIGDDGQYPEWLNEAISKAREERFAQETANNAPNPDVVSEEDTDDSGSRLSRLWDRFAGAADATREWVQEHLGTWGKKKLGADQGPSKQTQEVYEVLAPSIGHTMTKEQLEKRSGDTLRASKESLAEHGAYSGGLAAEKAVEYGQGKVIEGAGQLVAGVVTKGGGRVRRALHATEEAAEAETRAAAGSGSIRRRMARPGNQGIAPPHGGPQHNAQIDRVAESMRKKQWTDIRKNQQQADAARRRMGGNRPDVGGVNPKTGQRVNIEYDTDPAASLRHQATVPSKDPNAVNVFIVIDPVTGKPISAVRK